VNWVVVAHWNTRICVDDAAFVKGTNTFLLWGAMNLGKVMEKNCEMGREAKGLTRDLLRNEKLENLSTHHLHKFE
jgi:hypothetical protein